jgi:hypothetical protein
LELGVFSYDIEEKGYRQRVKVYAVPPELRPDGYFVAVKGPGEVEVVPPSKAVDTVLLLDCEVTGDGETSTRFVHPAVRAAMGVPY